MSVQHIAIRELIDNGESFIVLPTAGAEKITDPIAMAVWSYLMSRPARWKVREVDVRKRWGIGRDIYQRCIRHLKAAGLLVTQVTRSDNGRIRDKELECRAMPLKPRKTDRRVRVDAPTAGKTNRRLGQPLRKDRENLSQTENNSNGLVTCVTNVGASVESVIEDVQTRYAARQTKFASSTRLSQKSAVALWNETLKEHYPQQGNACISKTLKFVLRNNVKNLKLPDGLWRKVLVYSIKNWDQLRITTFKWMTRDPMPSSPSFNFWQNMFRFFCQAYYEQQEQRDDIQVMDKLGLLDKRENRGHSKELKALQEENERLRQAHGSMREAHRTALQKTEELRERNKQLRRRTRPEVNLDEEIETWEERVDG